MLLDEYKPARFEALAYGSAMPFKSGGPGVSASGWRIRDKDKPSADPEGTEMPSEAPNRRDREATIRAIRGVVESSSIPPKSTVHIILRNKEAKETFNKILRGQRKNSDGKPWASWELWEEVATFVDSKALGVRASWVPKGELMDMDDLEEAVRTCAHERTNQLLGGEG